MSKRLVLPALAPFIAKTAGRNMTKAACAAVAAGVVALLTVPPTCEAARRAREQVGQTSKNNGEQHA